MVMFPISFYSLLLKTAIEIVDLPTKNGDFPVRFLYVYQAGYLKFLVPISEAERYGSSALVDGSFSLLVVAGIHLKEHISDGDVYPLVN